jgi:hypothetical protein
MSFHSFPVRRHLGPAPQIRMTKMVLQDLLDTTYAGVDTLEMGKFLSEGEQVPTLAECSAMERV